MKELVKNLKFAWEYTKDQKLKLVLMLLVNISSIFVSILVPIVYAKIMVELTNNEFYNLLIIGLLLAF